MQRTVLAVTILAFLAGAATADSVRTTAGIGHSGSIVGLDGANLVVDCTAGSMPAGITLGTFMADWADLGAPGAVPLNRTLAADTEALEIGATISVDRSTVTVSGAPVNLPYTVSVTFQ